MSVYNVRYIVLVQEVTIWSHARGRTWSTLQTRTAGLHLGHYPKADQWEVKRELSWATWNPSHDFLSSVKLKPTLDFSCIHLPVWNIIWKWSIHLSICQRVPFSQVTMILINNMNVAPLILRVDITLSDYPRALGLCSCNLKSGLHCLISPTKRRKREHPCGIMAYTPTVSTLILWAPFSLMSTLSEGWRAGLGGWEEQSTMR